MHDTNSCVLMDVLYSPDFLAAFPRNWLETKHVQILAKLQLLQFHKNSKFQKNDQSQSPKSDLNSPENYQLAPWNLLVGFDEHLFLKWSFFRWHSFIFGIVYRSKDFARIHNIDHNAAWQPPSCHFEGSVFGVVKKVEPLPRSFSASCGPWLPHWVHGLALTRGCWGGFFVVPSPLKKTRTFWILWECICFGTFFYCSLFWGMLILSFGARIFTQQIIF